MLRPRPLCSLLLTSVAVSACAGAPPPPPVPVPVAPTAAAEAPKAPPSRARWVFPQGRRAVKAKLELASGTTIYVGRDGLRELVKAGDAPVDARTLELDDFLGVLKDDKGQIVFVAADGDVFFSHDPLGALEGSRPGPLNLKGTPCGPHPHDANCKSDEHVNFAWMTTGKAAILGVARDGRLLRSADYGASWQVISYAGNRPLYGHPAAIELDGKGNGLLLHHPQRVFVTHDDGATWALMPTPGIGGREIRRDGDDRIWLVGRREMARLEGNTLKVTTEAMVPLVPRPAKVSSSGEKEKDAGYKTHTRTVLSGDHAIEFAEIYRHGKSREVEVSSALLGDASSKPAAHPMLIGASGLSSLIAGHGSELVYVRDDDDVDPTAPTSTVFRSKDFGLTWKEEAKLQGAEIGQDSEVKVAVGPGGWTFVTSLCPRYSPEGPHCEHRQIRPAGGSAFEDMQFTEEFAPTAFAFDRDHDRVYALGTHNGERYVYESPLSQNRFTRTKIVDVSSYVKASLTVDDSGTLRVFAWDSSKHAWALHKRPFGGEPLPVVYVPLESGLLGFAGARGVLFQGRNTGWETADGGDTWVHSTGVSASSLECTEAGCLDDDGSERVGWDLPAAKDAEAVMAVSEPPKPAERPKPASVAVTIVDAICKPVGQAAIVPAIPGTEMVDGRVADVRWASVKRDTDGKTAILVGSRNQVRETQLLPASPKAKPVVKGQPSTTVISRDKVLADGVVAARYTVLNDASGNRQFVDVDLAWWSAATGRSHRHELKKLPPFYVSSYSFTGTPQIVDGGLLFLPPSGKEVYFLRDEGKVETFTMPDGGNLVNAERLPKGWLLADSNSGNLSLVWTADGKEWARREWALDSSGTALMALIDGKPTISFARGSQPLGLFSVPPGPENDPPMPTVIDASAIDSPCDAHAATLRSTSYISSDDRRLRARIELNKTDPLPASRLTINNRVTHSTAAGKICTSAYTAYGSNPKTYDSHTAFLYPEAKGWSGWWFYRADDPKDATKKVVRASPVVCEAGLPEPKTP